MKVLVADDEKLVRTSLISMLEELDLPLQIVGEAANGEELVELSRKHTPDIAFIDIRMPKLNGLEAIKIAKDYTPNTKWIILTGFSEFDFAKEAIKLGASNYLLKPVSPQELKDVLGELIKQNKEYIKILNKEFENELIALCSDLSSLQDVDGQNAILNSHFICSVFLFDSVLNEREKSRKQKDFYGVIKSRISALLTNETRIALFVLPSGELATVGAWGFIQGENGIRTIQKYFDEILQLSRQHSSDSFSITVLKSDECQDFGMLHRRLNQLQNLSPLRVIMENKTGLNINDLVRKYEESHSDMLQMCNLLVKLSHSFKEKAYLNYMKILGDIERTVSSSRLFENGTFKKPASQFLACSMNCKIEPGQDLKYWVKKLKEHGEHLLADCQREESTPSDVIKQVITFIEQNYMHDIGIGQIAEQLNITPNYLSSLFHKKMDMTFMKYITNVRMLKAKELLSNHSAQVQQVAEKVGYYSTRHFTKLFKEFYGICPSEYRDSSSVRIDKPKADQAQNV